jgi:pyruvate dehydrogenase E2 component (dihydrolipoamide acetyltransferase)
MPFTVTLPKLSPTMEGGQIVAWHKKIGDPIAPGDLLIEVATDKATVEYQALDGGFLRQILVPAGQEAKVNQPIAICSATADESIAGYEPQWSGEAAAGSAAAPAPTSTAAPAAPLAPPAAPVTKPGPVSGAPRMPSPTSPRVAPPVSSSTPRASQPPGERIRASPYAKKLAAEHRLDLQSVDGTGPAGRIVARDLVHAQPLGAVSFGASQEPTIAAGSAHLEPLTPMRRVIGERLLESKTTIPHFYLSITVDASPLSQLRRQLAAWDLKVTVNDLVLRATALSLRQHPEVNSGWDPAGPAIVRYQTVDIAIAVAMPAGLITPIVTHADYKNVGELSRQVKELAARAKEGKLQPHEYQGGSFTISNLGMYGVDSFFPIINPPQAAILGVGGIQSVPVVKEGEVQIGEVMHLALAADHRVVDGAQAAQFLRTLKAFLENPAGLLV